MDTMEEILASEFSTEDTAFALDMYNFTEWRRSWTRDGYQVLPRDNQTGPKGGKYRWAHTLEMMLFSEFEGCLPRKTAHCIVHNLFMTVKEQSNKTRAALSKDELRAFMAAGGGSGGYRTEDGRPHELEGLVMFPALYFEPWFFDNTLPQQWLVFSPFHMRLVQSPADPSKEEPHYNPGQVFCVADQSIRNARQAVQKARAHIGMDEATRAHDHANTAFLMSVNITELVWRLNARLEQRLAGRRLGVTLKRRKA